MGIGIKQVNFGGLDVRMISFKSHVGGMVGRGQPNDEESHDFFFFFYYHHLHRKINICVPSKEIPSEASGLFLLPTPFSSVEINPSALTMVMKSGNSGKQLRATGSGQGEGVVLANIIFSQK